MKAHKFILGAAHPLSFAALQAQATDRGRKHSSTRQVSLARGWHTAGTWVWCSITMAKHFLHSPNVPHRSGAGDLLERSQKEQAQSFLVRMTSSAVVKSARKKQCSLCAANVRAGIISALASRARHAPEYARRHQALCGHSGTISKTSALSR